MRRAWLGALLVVASLSRARAEDEPRRSPFLGPGGEVRTIFRPEFRDAPGLLDDLARFGVEGLQASVVGPEVAVPGPNKPPVGARLLLRGDAEVVARAREVLVYLDVPRPSVVVSLLVCEVRATGRSERGGHVFLDRVQPSGAPDSIVRGAFADFEPESYLRSALTGVAPFQGTSLTFGTSPSDVAENGAFEYVLRLLAEEGEAEFLAWPTVVVSEGSPGVIESHTRLPDVVLSGAGPNAVALGRAIETGLVLTVTPQRVSRDAAVLGLVVDLAYAEPESPSAGSASPWILRKRRVQTLVSVRDQEPVLLGGLYLRRHIRNRYGVPWISSTPGLEEVGSAESLDCVTTELLLSIRARVRVAASDSGRFVAPGVARRMERRSRAADPGAPRPR